MLRLSWLALIAATALPMGAVGQVLSETPAGEDNSQKTDIGGKTSVDLIRLSGTNPSIPLRNAGVVRGSESLSLDGRPLKRGEDYGIDYPSGTVMLMKPFKDGQSLRAIYRFDPMLSKAPVKFGQNLNGMKLSFTPGATAILGFGMIERKEDGSIMQSDLYALRTNFAGGGKLGFNTSGMVALGTKRQVNASSLHERLGAGQAKDTGDGSAIIQNVAVKTSKGTIRADYQSIDQNFTSTAAFDQAGYTAEDAQRFLKERGLKRFGYGVEDVKFGNLGFNQSYSMVGDKGEQITRRSFGVETKGAKLEFSSHKVDSGFRRFQDLKDGDAAQLKNEAGLEHETWFADLGNKQLSLKMASKGVEDRTSKAFQRRSVALDAGKIKFNYGDQKVENGFTKFAGIREADWQQVAREAGLRRQSWGMELAPISKQLQGLAISSQSLRSDGGRFAAMDILAKGETWSLEHYSRAMDAGMQDMHRESGPALDAHVTAVAKMYEKSGIGIQGDDKNWFVRSFGLDRSGTRLTLNPSKGTELRGDIISFRGMQDSGQVNRYDYSTANTKFSFQSQRFGQNLTEIDTLMRFERERVSAIAGLRQDNASLDTTLGGQRKLSVSFLDASKGEADVKRTSLDYSDKNFELKIRSREVSSGFAEIGKLVDRDREILRTMVGNEQRQLQLNWLMYRDLTAKLDWLSQTNELSGETMDLKHSFAQYNPDKFTSFQWYQYHQTVTGNESASLFSHQINRMSVNRRINNFGAVSFEQEKQDFDGERSTESDRLRNTWTVEAQVNKTTAVKTEQSHTDYADGNREHISSHTVSSTVIPGTGVSVTDTNISRTGGSPDQRKRNYGFWVNLGKGVKLSYGYARDLQEGANGTLNNNVSLSGGTVGGLTFGNADYSHQRWDNQRNRSVGNFTLGSTKPFTVGFVKDLKFNIATNTVRDNDFWHRESNVGNFSAKLFGHDLGFDYLSQYHPQSRQRAIDRVFRFQTNGGDKAPLSAKVNYKVRTLPDGKQYDVRDIAVSATPMKNWKVTHQLQSYPEVPRGDVLLGTVLQPTRTIQWKLEQTAGANTLFGASWEERLNEQTKQMSRTAGVNLTLNAKNPSPIQLFYGIEQGDRNGHRSTAHRYSLRYDQKPGPNSNMSLFLGNLSWEDGRSPNLRRENWSMRLEWQVKF